MNDPSLLPTEIISLIVNHVDEKDLKACTLVNKQFYTTATPLLLWRTIHIKNKNKTTTGHQIFNSIVNTTPPIGHHVRHLDLGSCYKWTNDALLLLMPHVRLLETLVLRNAEDLTDTSLEHLPRHCPRLLNLNVGNSRITPLFFRALGQYCHQLWKLTLGSGTQDLTPDAFLAFGADCPLKVLVLDLENDDDDDYGALYQEDGQDEPIPFDLTGLHHLTHLTINRGSMEMLERILPTGDLDDNNFGTVHGLPQLTHLTLYQCYNIVDEMLTPFLEMHPDLKSLEVYGGDLCDGTLETIAECIPNIRNVRMDDIKNITDHGLRQLVRSCRQLTTVTCLNTEIVAEDMPEAGEHCLNLMVSEDEDACLDWLDEEAIDKIRKGCTHVAGGDQDGDGVDEDDDV